MPNPVVDIDAVSDHVRHYGHPRHLRIGRTGCASGPPEQPLTIDDVYELMQAAWRGPKHIIQENNFDLVFWFTGVTEDIYPGHDEECGTISFVWNWQLQNGALAQLGRIRERRGEALEWVNARANADGVNYLEIWGIAVLPAS